MVKVNDAILVMNNDDEYWQKLTSWYSYVFDHKMRTIYNWKAVEPILKLRKMGDPHHGIGVAVTFNSGTQAPCLRWVH